MTGAIGYYFSPLSGYAYLGHQAFLDLAREAGREVNYYPIDIGKVFTATGTTPPFKQSEARKSYRAEDMARYAKLYELPINLKPMFWPTDSTLACKAIIASGYLGFDQGLVSGAILSGVWASDIDISDPEALQDTFDRHSLPGRKIIESCDQASISEDLDRFTHTAIEMSVFGSPTYIIDNERYWGQDRLPMLRLQLVS